MKRDDNDVYKSTGILKFNKETLNFEADKTQLIIRTNNFEDLQNDMECTNTQSIWPKMFEMATIYGIDDVLTKTTFDSIDLCELSTNELIIPYFKPSQ